MHDIELHNIIVFVFLLLAAGAARLLVCRFGSDVVYLIYEHGSASCS